MKRIILTALALAAASPAVAAERRYSITDFDRMQVDGPYQVTLVSGGPVGAVATGSPQALDGVSIEVQGRTLRIRANRSTWGGYPGDRVGGVTIRVTGRDLVSAAVTGSGKLGIDRAKGLRLDLSVAGSGSLSVAAVDADNLSVGLLGSGKISLAGRAKQLRATISGTGDLAASGLRADDLNLTADSAGAIAVGAVRSAKVRATGQGEVEIIGAPACTVQGGSASQVKCGR